MRNQYKVNILLFVFMTLAAPFTVSSLLAQPEEITINHSEKMKTNRVAEVLFPHELHMESYECLDCHHKYENGENILEEDELEEGNPDASCVECHKVEENCQLQKTFHRQCMSCHVKSEFPEDTSPPRMCNGCHRADKSNEKSQPE